jgi:hypothetical protein
VTRAFVWHLAYLTGLAAAAVAAVSVLPDPDPAAAIVAGNGAAIAGLLLPTPSRKDRGR